MRVNQRFPKFSEALRLWLKIGCIGFGGPSGQIGILHAEVVETRKWISDQEFVRALQFCMSLPGPEAQQLATYLGWRLHGIRGGIAAGVLFVFEAHDVAVPDQTQLCCRSRQAGGRIPFAGG